MTVGAATGVGMIAAGIGDGKRVIIGRTATDPTDMRRGIARQPRATAYGTRATIGRLIRDIVATTTRVRGVMPKWF